LETSYSALTYKVRPRIPSLEAFDPTVKEGNRGSCVLLHGWDAIGSSMRPLCTALQNLPLAAGWSFFTPTYETHTQTFVDAAHGLGPKLQTLRQPIVLVGYSEGAIVARQMVADGLQVGALVTICGPHLGLGSWMPTPDTGSASVSPFSADLKALNDSAQDRAQRQKYHLFGISCTDVWGDHADDGVVPVRSAIDTALGAVAERVTIHLDYGDHVAGWDPHLRGMDPSNLEPVLDTCSQLFK
jgi:pimeloyl-ACP methyl ester carboxylesterase